jgi:bile acid:Na+ symporter, BASS family
MMAVGTALTFLLQGAMIASVLALGLNASAAALLYLWQRPGLLLRSFIAMYVVMPLIAVLLVLLMHLSPGRNLGLVLVAISAGAPLLPKTMLKLGCNPPYVYSLLVSTSLAAVLTIPASLAVLSPILPEHAREAPLSVAVVVARTFLAPLAVGMLLRRLAPRTLDPIRGPVLLVAGLVLVTVLLSLLVLNFSAVLDLDLPALGAIAILTFAGLAVGHLLGGPEPGNRTCLALACSTRHLGLAAVIALTSFHAARPLPIVLVFMVVSIVATILYAHWRKWREKSSARNHQRLEPDAVPGPKSSSP